MSFLAPLFLAGLVLATGPILFHLFKRAPRNRVVFSSTEFLEQSPPVVKRRRRIENPLLLIIRCLIIGLLCFAFARPFIESNAELQFEIDSRRDIVLAIDTSASMGREGIRDSLLAHVDRILEELDHQDRLAIVAFSRDASVLFSYAEWNALPPESRISFAKNSVRKLPIESLPGNLDLGIQSAVDALETLRESQDAHGAGEIIAISDFAEGSRISGLAGLEWPIDCALKRVAVTADSDKANVGLRWLGWSDSESETKMARLALVHSQIENPFEIEIEIVDAQNGEPISEAKTIFMDTEGERIIAFEIPDAFSSSPLEAVLAGDGSDFDNRLPFAPDFIPNITVSTVSSHDSTDPKNAVYFIEKALEGIRNPVVTLSQSIEDSDLTIIDGSASREVLDRLRNRLSRGHHALFLASAQESLGPIATLANSQPWIASPMESADALIGDIEFAHPLFSQFSDPRFSDFANIRFWKTHSATPPATLEHEVIARFDDESPAVIEVPIGQGKLIVWHSGWSPKDSQWPLSTKFVPWIHRLLERSKGSAPIPSNILIDDSEYSAYAKIGDWTPLDNDSNGIGAYRLNIDDTERWIALQSPPSESRVAPLPIDTWEKLGLPEAGSASSLARIASAEERKRIENASQSESRQRLWRWLILAAATLLAIESLVAIRSKSAEEAVA